MAFHNYTLLEEQSYNIARIILGITYVLYSKEKKHNVYKFSFGLSSYLPKYAPSFS